MRKPVPKRPLSADETLAIRAIQRFVTFTPASWDKRFTREVLCPSLEQQPPQLSEKAIAQLWRLFLRYRRQIHKQILPNAQDPNSPTRLGGLLWDTLLVHAHSNAAQSFRNRATQSEPAIVQEIREANNRLNQLRLKVIR